MRLAHVPRRPLAACSLESDVGALLTRPQDVSKVRIGGRRVEEKSTGGEPKVMACAERHAGWEMQCMGCGDGPGAENAALGFRV